MQPGTRDTLALPMANVPSAAKPATAPMGVLIGGKLRVERVIGEGAMGIVYEATDTTLGRRVAVKVISPDLVGDSRQRRRFEREARAAATLKSEHAVRILDVSADGEEPYLVMEYLEGRSLESIVLEDGRVPAAAAVDWILQALVALAEAHFHGLIHRDIKPANLFLTTRPGREPIVKVLDFGLVKDLDPTKTRLTKTGAAIGTPAYMAPEQVRAVSDLDARTDIWAIGATLYELLTGNIPFNAATLPELLTAIVQQRPAPLREGRPDIPEDLEPVVLRCLAKDRAARFASTAELGDALVTALGGAGGTVRLEPRRRAAATMPSPTPSALGVTLDATLQLTPQPSPPIAHAYAPRNTYASSPPAPYPSSPPAPCSDPRFHAGAAGAAGLAPEQRRHAPRPQSFALIFIMALLVVVLLGGLALVAIIALAPQLTPR